MQNVYIPAIRPFIEKRLPERLITIEDIHRVVAEYAAEVMVSIRNATCLELVANTPKYATVEDGHIIWNMEEVDKLNNKTNEN